MMFMNLALPQPAPTMADGLDCIIAGLCQVMANQCGIDRFIAPMCMILWVRLLRVSARFQVLFTRWREGRLPPARPPASHPPGSRKRPKRTAAVTEPKPALPRGFAWLLKFVPTADVYGVMLHHLLAEPEMGAFLAEVPQAGRLLRPLCRTLGVKPIPQMLRPQNPKPATPAPEAASPTKPPNSDDHCEPPAAETPAAETAAKKSRPEIAKKPDPGASLSHAGDPLWARPVSLWSRPPRPGN